MKLSIHLAASVFVMLSTAALGAECVGLRKLGKEIRIELPDKAIQVTCGSLSSVVSKIANRTRIGGRKLEDDRPLDVPQAQANVETALRDQEIRQRVEEVRREINDENTRLMYEAAIFDEEGYYLARDLRIQELSQRMK